MVGFRSEMGVLLLTLSLVKFICMTWKKEKEKIKKYINLYNRYGPHTHALTDRGSRIQFLFTRRVIRYKT